MLGKEKMICLSENNASFTEAYGRSKKLSTWISELAEKSSTLLLPGSRALLFFLEGWFQLSSKKWCDTTSKDTTALCRERCDCFCDCFNCQQKQQLHCLESSCTRNCLLEPNSCCLSFHRSVLICISFAKYFENSQGRIQSKEEQG